VSPRAFLAALATVTAIAVAFALAQAHHAARPHSPGLVGPRPAAQFYGRPAPRFLLADARGGTLTSRALDGRPYVVTFLYTRCTDQCPVTGAKLARALASLGARGRRVAVVGITVDPAHDSPVAARAWLRRLHEPANFHYLVGARRRLLPLWDAFSVQPQDSRYRDDTHSTSIWLVDRRGRLRVQYEAADAVTPGAIAHDLGRLLDDA
jgi:protein SCO1/2